VELEGVGARDQVLEVRGWDAGMHSLNDVALRIANAAPLVVVVQNASTQGSDLHVTRMSKELRDPALCCAAPGPQARAPWCTACGWRVRWPDLPGRAVQKSSMNGACTSSETACVACKSVAQWFETSKQAVL